MAALPTATVHEDDTAPRLREFRQLIYALSAEFISLPPHKISSEIEKKLQRIGEFWGFDQILLCKPSENSNNLSVIHTFVAPGIKKPRRTVAVDQIPWTMEQIRRGLTVSMPNTLMHLPPEAELDRRHIRKEELKSSIIMPLCTGDTVQGAMFFTSLRQERIWPEQLLAELRYLGQILASALERKRAADRIEEVIQFEHLLSEISATYISLPTAEIDQIVQRDLGRLGSFLKVDRCIFYLATETGNQFAIVDPYNWWVARDNDKVGEIMAWVKSDPHFFANNYGYCFPRWARGEIVQFRHLEDLPAAAEKLRQVHQRFGTLSWLSVPISVGGAVVGALAIATTHSHRAWSEDLVPRLRLFGEIFANAIKRKQSEESLRKAFSEIRQLKMQIEADYVYLREELRIEHNFDEIIGRSDILKKLLVKVERVAPTDSTVLILGETGTGKELIARAIHNASRRRKRPLIKVNCATLTPNLIESELFGHEKGAFTGAGQRRVGRFELAHGATLFLDEIGELPIELQPKLLRVLQEGEFERLGGSHTIKADVRIIAATNRHIEKEVEKGRFRSDLWYRLNTFPIHVPPLRERMEDIPLFVQWFINKYSSKVGKRFSKVSQKSVQALKQYSWPGNIRELENIIARAVITSEEGNLRIEAPTSPVTIGRSPKNLAQIEREFILRTLEDTNWKIEGKQGAAALLGLKPSTLRNRMKKLTIHRPNPK